MTWKSIFVKFEKYFKVGNSYKFYMPDGIGYDNYSFFHPQKLVDFHENDIVLIVNEDWKFKLTKSVKREDGQYEVVDTVYLSPADLEEELDSIPVLYTPPVLEPLENVEALEELLDE